MTNHLPPRVMFPQEKLIGRPCPACAADTLRTFYAVRRIPIQSNLLVNNADDAEAFPSGDVVLAQCETCAFITNIAFDESRVILSQAYEASHAASATFDAFAKKLAAQWIERYNLRGKTLIEIGCGQGEFLEMICELAGARGIGFDPVARRERSNAVDAIFVAGPFEDFVAQAKGDFIFCRHTLEHIAEPLKILSLLQPAAAKMPVVFEVPDTARVLAEGAFWDIFYEQNSYFSRGSLTRVFQRAGFEVTSTSLEFDNQHLFIEATAEPFGGQKRDMPTLTELRGVTNFVRLATQRMNEWVTFAREAKRQKQKCVVWGGGSKAVGFLATLGIEDAFECVVDLNPAKEGGYLPGTRLKIEPPSVLKTIRPDHIVVMNPACLTDIGRDLMAMGVTAKTAALQ